MEKSLPETCPSYAARVTAYLETNQQRRLPWGTMVVGGHLASARTSNDRALRYDIGEVAIALLQAMGVPMNLLEALINSTPWNVTPAELLAKVNALRTSPPRLAVASGIADIL
jgi:hypothetical protein